MNADCLLCYVPQAVNADGIVGVVIFNPQAPNSLCLHILGQEVTKLEIYVTIRLHDPLSILIYVSKCEILL